MTSIDRFSKMVDAFEVRVPYQFEQGYQSSKELEFFLHCSVFIYSEECISLKERNREWGQTILNPTVDKKKMREREKKGGDRGDQDVACLIACLVACVTLLRVLL